MGRFEGESCASYLYIMSLSDILFIVFFLHRIFFIGLRGIIGYILAARITHGI